MTAAGPAATPANGVPTARLPYPTKLFVEVTTRCNLRCAMCVKQSPGQQIAEGNMTEETFERLTPAFGRLAALILNGIGEPLMHRGLERFVAAARECMPATGWIGFQTNGMLLGEHRAASLVAAGVDRIVISADAVVNDQLTSIRDGAKISNIERAAGWVHKAADLLGRRVGLGLEFVVMRENLDQLPDVVRWAGHRRFAYVIVSHMLPYAAALSGRSAFSPSTDRALEIFRKWRGLAAADGVDIARYPECAHRFAPSESEARVVDYVRRMVEDAAEQRVSLRISDLLSFDHECLRVVEETFARAGEVAAATGIELRLPATVPTQVRHCDFVEDGSAFVSWNGDLHPCYFHWHGFQCHLGGLVRNVRPTVFGNVDSEPILDVWNGAPWVGFRDSVLRYDFPFCYDCNLAMCDYMTDGDFEQDCHIGTVPCAACLWCTGPFQCLR